MMLYKKSLVANEKFNKTQSERLQSLSVVSLPLLICVCLMIMAAPYYQYRFDLPGLPFHFTLHRFFLGLAFVSLFFQSQLRDQRHWRKALLWLTLWLVIEMFASLRSQFDFGTKLMLPRITGLASALLVLLIARNVRLLLIVLSVYIASALVPAAVTLWQTGMFFATGQFPGLPFQSFLETNLEVFDDAYKGAQMQGNGMGEAIPRAASVMVDPNFLASYLSVVAIIALGLYLLNEDCGTRYKKAVRYSLLASISLVLVASLLTFSRSGLLGLAFGVPCMLVFHPGRRHLNALLPAFLAMLLTVCVAGAIMFPSQLSLIKSIVETRLSGNKTTEAAEGRLDFVAEGFDAFLYNPVFGLGAGNMRLISDKRTAHSSPFTIAAESGLIGLLIIYGGIWMMARPLLLLLSSLKDSSQFRTKRGRWGSRKFVLKAPDSAFQPLSLIQHNSTDEAKLPSTSDVELAAAAATILGATLSLMAATFFYDHLRTLEVNWVFLGVLGGATGVVASTKAMQRRSEQSLRRITQGQSVVGQV